MIFIYAIYDKKAKVYQTPFFMRQDEEAVRALREAIAAGDSLVSRYPEDYKLYRIGEWDEETAEIFYKHSSMMEINEIQYFIDE
jgi:hypothetical protein